MAPEVTYEYYSGTYGGRLDEASFGASLASAEAAVRYVIGFNVPETERQITAYQRAVCAAIDVDYINGASGGVGGDISSVSIGSFSASRGGGADAQSMSSYDADMRRAIVHELCTTGLLYQGLA